MKKNFFLLLFLPLFSFAHSPIEGIGNFYNGVLHPFFVPEHLLLLIVFGMFVGQRGLEKSEWILFSFLGSLLIGIFATNFIVAPIWSLKVVIILMILVSVFVMLKKEFLYSLYMILSVGIGILIGLDSAQEELLGSDRWVGLFGSLLGVMILFLYSVALVDRFSRKEWQSVVVRVIASWISASGLLMFALLYKNI